MAPASGSSTAFVSTVTKLRASDGLNQGTFSVGRNPVALAFDGVSVWVANFSDNTVTRLRSTDGLNMGTFPTGRLPDGVAFDGANIWVANQEDGTVSKL